MRSLRLSFGITLIASLLLSATADQIQHPLVEDIQPALEPVSDTALPDDVLEEPVPPPVWSLCGTPSEHLLIPYPSLPSSTKLTSFNSDKNGVTIDPAQPMVGENITVTVKGRILKRVTAGKIDVDLRLMKFIKLTPQFDLCDQLDGELFQESNVSCPLEEGPVTLIARKLIPEDVPKVSVAGNITLTNQDGETLTCMAGYWVGLTVGVHIDVVLQSRDGKNRYWFF
jgi:hypothetical protein